MDRDELLRVLRAFEAAGLDYVLIGATAMGFHGVIRATEDVDRAGDAYPGRGVGRQRDLRHDLGQGRDHPVGHGLRLRREHRCLAKGVDAPRDEHRGQHGTGYHSNQAHGPFIP